MTIADVDSRLDLAGVPMLSVRHVGKSFGAVVVAADLSFEVAKGSTLGVLGPNGAGKTTLFNMIAGDVQLDSGEIWLEGERLDPLPAHRRAKRGLSRSYQVPQPFGHMTVFENLLVAAVFGRDLHEKQAHTKCFAVLEDTGLMAKANHRAGSLPLLDRKRLELARALASEPGLLLLDEIAGGLTDDEASELVELIKRVKRTGVTVVWIEHVIHALMAVADEILVMDFGRKIIQDRPEVAMANPEVQRVYMGIEA